MNTRELSNLYYNWSYNTDTENKTIDYITKFNALILEYRSATNRNSLVLTHKKSNKVVASAESYIKSPDKVRIVYEDGSKTVLLIRSITSTFILHELSLWDNLNEDTELDLKFARMGVNLNIRDGGWTERS